MNNGIKRLQIVFVFFVFVMTFTVSCGSLTAAGSTIKLNKKSVTIKTGDSAILKLKNAKAKKVKWTSKDTSIATVNNGVVFAKKEGKTTIIATYQKKKYRCKITVEAENGKQAGNNTLVAYFSCTGSTKGIAEGIASIIGADMYEIVPKQPYTEADLDYYSGGRCDQEQDDPFARPVISGSVSDMDHYDTVVIGHPIWHGQAPRIISTFLESYDFGGKTLVTFCTSHSSGLGSSAENLHPLVPDNVTWLESRRFPAGASRDEIKAWLDEIGLTAGQEGEQVGQFDFESHTVMLNSGYEMPIIGLGTWTLSDDDAENSVYHALKCGMRLIDTARYYGNEVGVGHGLQKAIDEGIVTREEVFITSKIYGGNYEKAGGIIDDAIRDLNVEYIDLLLIHQPGADDEGVYKAMEDAVNDGRLRSIGISNYYTKEQVDEVLSFATITPSVIQNENHIYYQNTELQEYVKQYGIVIESWYPFGGRGHTSENFNNEVIKDLSDEYDKTSAQIILRWQLQAGFIAIPGSSNPDHIAENYDIFDFELSEENMQKISLIDEQRRYESW